MWSTQHRTSYKRMYQYQTSPLATNDHSEYTTTLSNGPTTEPKANCQRTWNHHYRWYVSEKIHSPESLELPSALKYSHHLLPMPRNKGSETEVVGLQQLSSIVHHCFLHGFQVLHDGFLVRWQMEPVKFAPAPGVDLFHFVPLSLVASSLIMINRSILYYHSWFNGLMILYCHPWWSINPWFPTGLVPPNQC